MNYVYNWSMQSILELLEEQWLINEWTIMDDKQMIAIYKATTWEEVESYNNIIQLFLENEQVPYWDLQSAVSFFYMKLNLLERKLIENID